MSGLFSPVEILKQDTCCIFCPWNTLKKSEPVEYADNRISDADAEVEAAAKGLDLNRRGKAVKRALRVEELMQVLLIYCK